MHQIIYLYILTHHKAEGAAILAYIAETRNLTSYYPTDAKVHEISNLSILFQIVNRLVQR